MGQDQRHRVTIRDNGGSFTCTGEDRVLIAMERCGQTDIPVGCRGGGCGVCRVQVLEGAYETGPMSRRHVGPDEKARGLALACRLYARGDLVLALDVSPDCLYPVPGAGAAASPDAHS